MEFPNKLLFEVQKVKRYFMEREGGKEDLCYERLRIAPAAFALNGDMSDVEAVLQFMLKRGENGFRFADHHVLDTDVRFKMDGCFGHLP
jgi:hypothetical protein